MVDNNILKLKKKYAKLLKDFMIQERIVTTFNQNFTNPYSMRWRAIYLSKHYNTPRLYFNHLVLNAPLFLEKYSNTNPSSIEFFFKYAFDWKKSIEGYRFWHDIQDKWCNLLQTNI
jgi:hypothetical protein